VSLSFHISMPISWELFSFVALSWLFSQLHPLVFSCYKLSKVAYVDCFKCSCQEERASRNLRTALSIGFVKGSFPIYHVSLWHTISDIYYMFIIPALLGLSINPFFNTSPYFLFFVLFIIMVVFVNFNCMSTDMYFVSGKIWYHEELHAQSWLTRTWYDV
jgi:hypothetical protein